MKTRRSVVTIDLTAESEDESRNRYRGSKRSAEDTLKVCPKKKMAKNILHDRMKNNLSKLLGKSPQDNASFICEDPNLISFRQELMSDIQITNPGILFVRLGGNVPYDEAMTFQKRSTINSPFEAKNKNIKNKASKNFTLRSSQSSTKNNCSKNTNPTIIDSRKKTPNITSLIKVSDLRANIAKKCANGNIANNKKNSTIKNTSQKDINNMRQSVRLRFRNEISKASKYQSTKTPNAHSPSIAVDNLRQKVMAKCTKTTTNTHSTPSKQNKNTSNNSNVFVNIRQSVIEKCRIGAEKINANKNQIKTTNLPKNAKATQDVPKIQTRSKKEKVQAVSLNLKTKKNETKLHVSKGNDTKKKVKTETINQTSVIRRSCRTPRKKTPDGKSSR